MKGLSDEVRAVMQELYGLLARDMVGQRFRFTDARDRERRFTVTQQSQTGRLLVNEFGYGLSKWTDAEPLVKALALGVIEPEVKR